MNTITNARAFAIRRALRLAAFRIHTTDKVLSESERAAVKAFHSGASAARSVSVGMEVLYRHRPEPELMH